MHEYKIKFRIHKAGYFSDSIRDGVDIIKADSASEAKEIWKKKFESEIKAIEEMGMYYTVVDIEKF